jgi:hypothetical protein
VQHSQHPLRGSCMAPTHPRSAPAPPSPLPGGGHSATWQQPTAAAAAAAAAAGGAGATSPSPTVVIIISVFNISWPWRLCWCQQQTSVPSSPPPTLHQHLPHRCQQHHPQQQRARQRRPQHLQHSRRRRQQQQHTTHLAAGRCSIMPHIQHPIYPAPGCSSSCCSCWWCPTTSHWLECVRGVPAAP